METLSRWYGSGYLCFLIWKLMNLKNITNSISNDDIPMWKDDKIYYLSDAGAKKRNNIWVYDTKTKAKRQITFFKDFDINFPSIGPEDIVFEAGGKLYLLNLKTEKYNEVKIDVVSDFAELKPEYRNVSKFLHFYYPSPDGNRILVEARGEIFSVPKEYGVVKNISNSSASAERYPSWSPDGKNIAYWSDKSGEYQLVIKDAKTGKENVLTDFKNGFRYSIYWSPDSKMAAFIDQEGYFSTIDMSSGTINRINKIDGNHYTMQGFRVSWSPDSKWVTYSKAGSNDNGVIYVYDLENKKSTALTSGFYNDFNPVFDSKGKYIYFVTNRNYNAIYSDYEGSWVYPNATSIGIMPLEKLTPSLFSERNDTVAIKIENAEENKDSTDKKDVTDSKDKFTIDFNNIEERIEIIPELVGNLGNIASAEDKILFVKYPNSGEQGGQSTLSYYDTKERKIENIASDVNDYDLTADGKSLMVLSHGKAYIVGISPNQKLEKEVNTSNLDMEIDPKAEWKQIFHEVWRLERDFFYDKDMHGVDWDEMYKRYSKLIDQCASRYDVNFVIGQLLGEMNASHTYVSGGDMEYSKNKNIGYLGINWAKDGELYKVAHIVRPASWETEVKSPLVQAGVDIDEGDYIFSVNGKSLSDFINPFDAFVNLADKTVELVYGKDKDISKAKTAFVKTLRDETRLRNLEWIENNRKRVDEETSGRAGYIYVPSTALDGQDELVRQFYAQWSKDALIIDERFNNGGQIPDRFVELLNRKALSYMLLREEN
ncbi:MAG: PDZ domain-containing protein [Saprospiraceae bacterium]